MGRGQRGLNVSTAMTVIPLTELSEHIALNADVLEWIRTATPDIAEGRYEFGEKVYANVELPEFRTREDAKLELHHRYIDIHIPLRETETIGWTSADSLIRIVEPGYDAARDIAFYNDDIAKYYDIKPGECAIVLPSDGHAPNIGKPGTANKKICVKVPTNDRD